jgi:hypothetical protein
MVFNTTFNNISVISWRSILLVEETEVPGKNHWPAASHWQTLSHNVVTSMPRLSGIRTHNINMGIWTITLRHREQNSIITSATHWKISSSPLLRHYKFMSSDRPTVSSACDAWKQRQSMKAWLIHHEIYLWWSQPMVWQRW